MSKRLTQRDEFDNADVIALSDTMPELYAELSFSEANALTVALNKLAAYEDAEEQGRIIVLPCKVGDVVYSVFNGKARELKVISYSVLNSTAGNYRNTHSVNSRGAVLSYELCDFGKTVFLTREEAERALTGRSCE